MQHTSRRLSYPPIRQPRTHPNNRPLRLPADLRVDCRLAAYPLFNDKWVDYSGNDNHGAINGAVNISKGRYGPAWFLNGVNSSIDFGNDDTLHPDNITVVIWVYPYSAQQNQSAYLSCRPATNDAGFTCVRSTNSDNHYFFLRVGAAWKNRSWLFSDLNAWHMVAMSYDQSTMRVVVDDTPLTSLDAPGTITWGTEDYTAGYDKQTLSYKWCELDEILVFSRALDVGEILALYEQGRPR